MMKKICSFILSLCLIFSIIPLSGCSNKKSDKSSNGILIYYMDKQYTTLLAESYTPTSNNEEDLLQEMIYELKKNSADVDKVCAIPDNVEVESLDYNTKNKVLNMHFNEAYNSIDKGMEILVRAAIVLTITQLDMVNYIEIYVGDDVLYNASGKRVGKMSENSFADNFIGSEISGRTKRDFTIYYANSDYSALVPYRYTGTYLADASLETYIIKELISGPDDDRYNRTLSADTNLISAITTDGVCYVNFGEDFETLNSGYNNAIVIYSIVNSLLELNHITMVRISINGKSDNTFNGMSLEDAFSKNLDIVEEIEN